MFKQTFDSAAIAKVLTAEDVWRWNLWTKPEEKENALNELAHKIQTKDFQISPLKSEIKRGKLTYQANNVEDVILIRLLDRYIRRIYKVRQADRNRIIRQVKIILEDSGSYSVMRLDIKQCYESMDFGSSIKKLTSDMILSPSCICLVDSIFAYCNSIGLTGLPRGLAISPTLAELYLEPVDKFIKGQEGVIYSTRYVDDIFILVDNTKVNRLTVNLKAMLKQQGLLLNEDSDKHHIRASNNANFNYLGYAFSVSPVNNNKNKVYMTISNQKLNRIKQKIVISLNEHKKAPDLNLLKQRLNYLTVLKVIKKNDNGVLLGGLAYNYQYVSDFSCLKTIDGFLMKMLSNPRFRLNHTDKTVLSKLSFFGSVSKKKKGNFTRSKASKISRVWKDA